MRFKIKNARNNKLTVEYGELMFPCFIDVIDGKNVVNKPKSIYISPEAFEELVQLVLEQWRILKNNENSNITTSENDL